MKSWIESANDPATDFPLENLPYGVFQEGIGVAIGDFVLSLGLCAQAGYLEGLATEVLEAAQQPTLNRLMILPREARASLRRQLQDLLKAGQRQREGIGILLTPIGEARMRVPVEIGDYTDFYASVFHATNVGRLFRPEHPLLPNYKYVPIGYHGRASSIVVSGTPIARPSGQIKLPDSDVPVFAPSRALDYELEVGLYAGKGNDLGCPVPITEAESHVFGFSLVNDWSARDIQSWEYQPLGPFLAKNFATSVSPWVVTIEALEPFRTRPFQRPEGDPVPLPYLTSPGDRGFDITLDVFLSTAQMRSQGCEAVRVSRSNLRDLYWTPAQLLTHHTSNGCNLRTGDLLASGTVSGAERGSEGCLLEMTKRGAEPITLPSGETRKFLDPGDEVILRGYCEREGARRIGFGECRGIVT
ncbi:MAG: fumarylacetoacetase [Acidobacteriota bacterium]|nr:fumarylacetoacetase [Acidobacteriota bacterium]